MKFNANQHPSDTIFSVGDWVYLKLQPCGQLSTMLTKHQKLSKCYYGLFQILERISPVACKLDLPSTSKIHPVFDISSLKPHKRQTLPTTITTFPSTFVDNHLVLRPNLFWTEGPSRMTPLQQNKF